MDAIVDYPSSSNPSNVNGMEVAPSSSELNWSDPRSPRLSDVVYFLHSSGIVCISSDESDEPPLPKKKLTDFFKPAKTRTPAFPNDLCWCKQQTGSAKKQQAADRLFADCRRPGVFVNMIASNCCLNSEFKSCHFIEQCP